MDELPLIAITMGDPAGIGPEIVLKALERDDICQVCRPLVLGDMGALTMISKTGGLATFEVKESPLEVTGRPGVISVIPVSNLEEDSYRPGKPTIAGGKAMVEYIVKAVELTTRGQVSAMVTCPINKELMHRLGHQFDGHTELLAHLTHTKDYVMMLAGDRLRVSLVTIHCALREVPERLSKELVEKTIIITYGALRRDFAITDPKLAVVALNPHAGESGLFGLEDEGIIRPAVEAARKSGLQVDGPFPADTVFYQAANGRYDAVVAMYHDQGLIPLKLLHFPDAVNITLGLPIIRTSVDHGTAYDIVGKDMADPSSLVAAIKMAAKMVRSKERKEHPEAPKARAT